MKRAVLILIVLAIALAAIVLIAVLLGSEPLPLFETLQSLSGLSNDLNEQQIAILWEIRLPRVALGASVGACLSTLR